MKENDFDSQIGTFARIFAQNLIDGAYDQAYLMLNSELQALYPPDRLKASYETMISYWDVQKADDVSYLGTSDLDDWEQREPDDLGWVYVSIDRSSGYCEAISVIITQEPDRLAIRCLEWGRP